MIKINDLIGKIRNLNSSAQQAHDGVDHRRADHEANTRSPSSGAHAIENMINRIPVYNQQIKTWYEDRYGTIIVQRNLLLVLLLILLCLSVVAIGVVAYVVSVKRFDPFVIQIDDTTGVAQVINPTSSNMLKGNEALAQYFIKKYVIARETYNPVDFSSEAKKTVRLLSSNAIYWNYYSYIKNEQIDPAIRYGQKNTTFLLLKSWSKLADNKYMMRFSINETAGAQKVFNKIAVVEFEYLPMELTESDRDINPIGFQVTGYRVDDDHS